MAYALLGILVLAILASFLVAYMSARSWPIYQAVLVAFIFLGTVVFFYMAARTLATHKAWRELVERREAELAGLEGQILPLRGGLSLQGQRVVGEIPQLKHELALITRARGGVYYDVTAESVKDGVVQLNFEPPAPPAPDPDVPVEPVPAQPGDGEAATEPVAHGLVADTVLFAFDQKPASEGGRFLGEFKVVAAPEGSPAVQIAPNLPLTAEQAKRLEGAVPGTWTLYTTMPPDDAAVLASLDDEARQAMLPADSAAEFAKTDRELRDYQLFFHENYVQRSLLSDSISKTTTNIQRTEAATAEAVAEAKYRDAEKTNLQADLEKFQFEVQAIAAYEKSVDAALAQVRAQLRATYIENRRAANTLSSEQLRAAAEIDQRTGSAAQTAR